MRTPKLTDPKKPFLVDSTLRDGQQASDVLFSQEERLAITGALLQAGIPEIEIGIPQMGAREISSLNEICLQFGAKHFSVWCRARMSDLILASSVHCDTVNLSLDLSRPSHDLWACVKKAAKLFKHVSVGIQNASRQRWSILRRTAVQCWNAGAFRVRLADTSGILDPLETRELCTYVATQKPPEALLGFHAHNDLGMASANAYMALRSGAGSVDVTVNGLGERCGNASLEQLALMLELKGPGSGINCEKLMGLCSLVAQASGRPLAQAQPICGETAFTHESGMHQAGVLDDPTGYEAYPPEMAGRKGRRLSAGLFSGRSLLKVRASEQGLDLDQDQLSHALEALRQTARRLKRTLTESELSLVLTEAKGTK